MSKKKILIVDDEPKIVDLITALLEDKGYETRGVYDGAQGLQEVEKYRPDLIILDILMPVIDGTVMASKLQNNPDTKDIPILFLSCLASGGSNNLHYFAKPFKPEELLETVNRILEKK